jgi:uncharacterized lipoprotein YmbA
VKQQAPNFVISKDK